MSSRSCFKSVRASGYFLIDVELNRGERFTVLALLLLAEPDAADVIAERTRGPRQALVRRNSEEVINIERACLSLRGCAQLSEDCGDGSVIFGRSSVTPRSQLRSCYRISPWPPGLRSCSAPSRRIARTELLWPLELESRSRASPFRAPRG
jgi:hypothetical protein